MTFTIKSESIGNHYIELEQDAGTGLITVIDCITDGSVCCRVNHLVTYSPERIKSARAAYNRYRREAKI